LRAVGNVAEQRNLALALLACALDSFLASGDSILLEAALNVRILESLRTREAKGDRR